MRSRWRLSRPPACSVSFLWFRQKYFQLLISNDLIIPCLDVFFFIFLGVHRASRISEFYRFHQVYKQRWPFLSILPLPAATPMRLLACWTPSLGSSRCFAFSRCLFSLCFSLASFYSTGYESTSHFFYGVESEAHMIKIFFSYFYFSIRILKRIPSFFFMFSYKYLNILMQSLGLFLVTDFSRDYGS